MRMDSVSVIKLMILEDDFECVIDSLLKDMRIDEGIRKEYGKRLREVLYRGIDGVVNGGGYPVNFK
jgi:hypothetical protein